ncbi:MAG TPA: glycosyltransferase family 2 protein [Verrucomicrobiae bacterium]|nr:glycosyltransferase family 2 protein [Verrucomicrobiae bacterium]
MNISVCVATYQRPARLRALLGDLAQQTQPPQEVVVVDNDPAESGRVSVEQARRSGTPFPVHYAIEPRKNVSHARNRCVEMAQGDWLAFLDDDERAPRAWLALLADAAERLDAEGVLGPVDPVVPTDAPAWLRRGRFYEWARLPTGTVVPVRLLRFGNVLLSAAVLRREQPPFDPAYGLTGGEDGDLLARLVQGGARIVWCDEAAVTEPVEPARLSLRWLLLRSLRGGQDFARHVLAGRHGAATFGRTRLLLRALAQMLAAAVLAVLCLPLGRHRAALWLTRASANFGKLTALAGMHYREYA